MRKGTGQKVTYIEMARDYINTSEQILARIDELKTHLKNQRMTATEKQTLRKRIKNLEQQYWTARSTGKQLLREYGNEEGG